MFDRRFILGIPVPFTYCPQHHDITEIFLNMVLNTYNHTIMQIVTGKSQGTGDDAIHRDVCS